MFFSRSTFSQVEHFSFLSVPRNSRYRTVFYHALGRLVLVDSESVQSFSMFVEPIRNTLVLLMQEVQSGGLSQPQALVQ